MMMKAICIWESFLLAIIFGLDDTKIAKRERAGEGI
jgi:hypothetical protein